eukprot:gene10848-19665_t
MEQKDSSAIPGQQFRLDERQLKNDAGGYVFKIDDLDRLKRFLVLGADGGTYYAGERELAIENIKCIADLICNRRGKEVVDILKTYSVEGRCPKQITIVYALAFCARYHNGTLDQRFLETRKAAYDALNKICRIPTDLFHFVAYCEDISKSNRGRSGTGWGRAQRKAISKWYLSQSPTKLAYHVTKYKQRDGWSHRDLLRLSHPKPSSKQKSHQIIFRFVTKGFSECKKLFDDPEQFPSKDEEVNKTFATLNAAQEALQLSMQDIPENEKEEKIIELIKNHDLVREHIPNTFLQSLKMPMTALIRNLGKMSSEGMFEDSVKHNGTEIAHRVADWLKDEKRLEKARIHPFNVLLALKTYESGKGDKGSKTWNVNKNIVGALDEAFYKSFKFVKPTNKRYFLGIDVSGSMSLDNCNGCSISPALASAAMAMTTLRTEPKTFPMAFSDGLVPLKINKDMKLADILKETKKLMFGSTDCAQPMIHAMKESIEVDVFIVYTDNETWTGDLHPFQALVDYRKKMNIPHAKLIVCAMAANEFTIADPDDPLMLDIAGFDSAAPQIIAEFAQFEPQPVK